jgi:hypothetical protein
VGDSVTKSERLNLVWIHTTCDHCGREGLRVLVPQNTDGSVAGREFPSLCSVCQGIDGIREKVVQKFLAEERADGARVLRGGKVEEYVRELSSST